MAVSLLTEQRWHTQRHCELRLQSQALSREAVVHVLVPDGFQLRQPAGLPLLLMLHGADAQPWCWEQEAAIVERTRDLDAMVVMPDCGVVGFCTDWRAPQRAVAGRIDGDSAPAWERFHLDEVLPLTAQLFGAHGPRVVAGVSMGGYGALAYAARRPGLFTAAASYSGLLNTLGRGIPTFIAVMLLREKQPRHALWGSPLRGRGGWRERNPLALAERLRGTALYISRADGRAAAGDPPMPALTGLLERIIGPSSDQMATRLAQLGIPVTVSRGQGVHMWPTWNRELDRSWEFLRAGLGAVTEAD